MKDFCQKNVGVEIRGSSKYELFALTVHIGSIRSGHYIAYVKRDNMWIEFDD